MKTLRSGLPVLKSTMPVLNAGSWRPAGASSNDRGYTWAWRKARDRYLAKHPVCVMCEARDILEPANVVDHRIPHRGDQTLFWDENNWQSLCTPCHSGEKQRQEKSGLEPQLP